MTSAPTRTTAWTPLRHPAFRLMWLAFLTVQLTNWSETVGAVEVIAAQSDSAALLALVQAAATAPAVLLALLAGAAADLIDRRLLLIALTSVMAASMALLTALVAADVAPPAAVLALTFVQGAAIAVAVPSFSAYIPDLVPSRDLAGAVTLNGISVNLARAVGPAVAGLVLVFADATTLFALITVTLVALVVLLALRAPRADGPPPGQGQPVREAIGAGLEYARSSPPMRAVLVRGFAFVLPASALWALMPVVAVQKLDLGADAFGGILAAVGAGAVLGAQILPWLRERLALGQLVAAGSAYGAVNLALLAVLESPVPVVATLVVAGAAWIAVLSSLHTSAQLAAPAWVRGRALSVNQLVFSLGMAGGSVWWGVVAERAGLETALFAAAAVLALALVPVARRWALPRVETASPG